MIEKQIVAANSLANVIEIGKLVLLQSGSDAYRLPEERAKNMGTSLADLVSEDLAAALQAAMSEAKLTREAQ